MPGSVTAACEAIEDLVYTSHWDGRYKDAIKTKLGAADFLEYESVAALLLEVVKQVSAERTVATAAAVGAAAERTVATVATAAGYDLEAGISSSTAATHSCVVEPEMVFLSLCQGDQDYWGKHIDKLIKTYVQLIPDQKTQAQLENCIKDCPLSPSIRGDPMGLVLYHDDVKQSGEPQTRADLRIAPLRDAIYHRLVRVVLNARAPAGHTAALRAGEVALVLDGGRKGNAAKLLAP